MKNGRTAPLNGRAANITEDDVMLKALMKELFGEARRQSEDSVQHENCIAYFYVNRSYDGRKFVRLSLHRLAKVEGKRRAFNSFNAEDLVNFPGLLQKAARWLCHEQSTAHATRQKLAGLLRFSIRFGNCGNISDGMRPK